MVAMGQRRGGSPLLVWFPSLLTFGMVLVGLIWFEIWAIGHRHEDG